MAQLRMASIVNWLLSGLAIFVVLAAAPQDVYISHIFHYSFAVPPKWRIADDGRVPYVYNYPRSAAGPQGQFPHGGATIRIIALEGFPSGYASTIESWITVNTRLGESNVMRENFTDMKHDLHHATLYAEIRSHFQLTPSDPVMQHIRIYFLLNDKPFQAYLEYYADDPNGQSYVTVLRSIVHSVAAR